MFADLIPDDFKTGMTLHSIKSVSYLVKLVVIIDKFHGMILLAACLDH